MLMITFDWFRITWGTGSASDMMPGGRGTFFTTYCRLSALRLLGLSSVTAC